MTIITAAIVAAVFMFGGMASAIGDQPKTSCTMYNADDMAFFNNFGKKAKAEAKPIPKAEKTYSLKKSTMFDDSDMEFFQNFDLTKKKSSNNAIAKK